MRLDKKLEKEISKQVRGMVKSDIYTLQEDNYQIKLRHTIMSIAGIVHFQNEYEELGPRVFKYSIEQGKLIWMEDEKNR